MRLRAWWSKWTTKCGWFRLTGLANVNTLLAGGTLEKAPLTIRDSQGYPLAVGASTWIDW